MKRFGSERQKKGKIGEDLAESYLRKRGFRIIERNYTRKWGEIDIVCEKGGITHFVEVKSVSCESSFRPEEQVHAKKQIRLARTIGTYIFENRTAEWRFHVITVRLDHQRRVGRVEMLSDLTIGRS